MQVDSLPAELRKRKPTIHGYRRLIILRFTGLNLEQNEVNSVASQKPFSNKSHCRVSITFLEAEILGCPGSYT